MWRVIVFLVCIGVGSDLLLLEGRFVGATVHVIKQVSGGTAHYMTRRL